MKHLRNVLYRYRFLIGIYVLMGLATAFLQTFGAGYFRTVADNFTSGTLTFWNIAVYGASLLSLNILNYLDEYPQRKLENGFALSLKTDALRKVSVIDYLSYVRLGTGTIFQRIESGAAAGANILFEFYIRLISELIPSMVFSVIFVYAIDKTVVTAILIGYIVVFLVTNLLLKVLYRVKERILVNEETFNHLLVRGFMEMVVFRVNRRFRSEIRKAEAAASEIVSGRVKVKMIHEAFFTIFAVLVGIAKIGIIAYGWSTKSLTIGQIVALIALIDNAYTPVAIFNVNYVDYKLDCIAFKRYAEFLDANDDKHIMNGREIPGAAGDIRLSGVAFQYRDREILKGFDLTIPGGSTIALVGESGSGKSTVVKLLAGLLRPGAGQITIGGQDLDAVKLDSYYAHIAYLPQDPAVFDGTLRENLVFDEAVPDEALIDALTQVGLLPLFEKLERGLHTPLGERGVSLSGGERQQLALARLWFTRADIILFDEATSAIDNLTEEAVMKSVMRRLSGRTVVAVAHRLDSVKGFDEIVVMRDGCPVERGGFAELLAQDGYFKELYERRPGVNSVPVP